METEQLVEKKKNNTPIIIIGVVLLLCCCITVAGIAAYVIFVPAIQNINEQVQQGLGYSGNADELLKTDVLNAIADYENSQNGCSDVSLLGGQILLAPDQTSDGSWSETWQVGACDASHLYSISFTPSPTGGTDFSVKRIDQ